MTIDSDNEVDTKVKSKKQPVIVSQEDEAILPGGDIII